MAKGTSFDEHKFYFEGADGAWIAVFPAACVVSVVRSDSVRTTLPA
jgi:hypothetical protein